MAGLYFHIPFCRKKCIYCDFYSVANTNYIQEFQKKLIEEIYHNYKLLNDQKIETLYFGGGTPSMFPASFFEDVFNTCAKLFKISSSPEITIEANPEDLNSRYCKDLRNIGFNRISIGTQNFDNLMLKVLSRNHSVEDSLMAVENAFNAGFNNISIDFIYGIPNMDLENLNKQLKLIFKLPIVHLSAYYLTVENGTILHKRLLKGEFQELDDEIGFSQYKRIIEFTNLNGFKQYEISNFALGDKLSKHNSAYWSRSNYLGFGPSAHSFIDNIRYYCNNDIKNYLTGFTYEKEVLGISEIINETIMLSLRTNKGLNIEEYLKNFGENEHLRLLKRLKKINPEYYFINSGNICLTINGMFMSDYIISELFV